MPIGFYGIITTLFALGVLSVRSSPEEVPDTTTMSVYAASSMGEPSFRVTIDGADSSVVSIRRVAPDRPLLIVVDPSFSPAELRQQMRALAQVLSAPGGALRFSSLRIGVTMLNGVLSDPVTRPREIARLFDQAVASYASGSATETQANSPGRIVDLIAALIEKAEADGPVDCLIIARDLAADPGISEYMQLAMERRLVQATVRRGSTVYGHFSHRGLLSDLVGAAGGETLETGKSAADLVTTIAASRAHGYVLEVRHATAVAEGRSEVSASDSSGTAVRAPRAIWTCVHGHPVPSCAEVADALDLLRRAQQAEQENDLERAAAFLERSVVLDDANAAAAVAEARIALVRRDYSRAAECASRAARTRPLPDSSALAIAEVIEESGRAQAVHEVIQSLQQRRAKIPAKVLARLFKTAGDYPNAVDSYRRALREGVPASDICGDYGWALLKSGDDEAAATQLEGCTSEGVTALLARSEVNARAGKVDEALSLAESAAKIRLNDADVRFQLGKLRAERRQWEAAAQDLEAAATLDPSRADILPLQIQAEIAAGRRAQAGLLLARRLTQARDASAYREVAELQTRIGNLDSAATTLESGAAVVSGERHELFARAAEIRERRGEFGQALLDYRAALGSAPEDISETLTRELSSHIRYLAVLIEAAEDGTPPVAPQPGEKESGLVIPGGIELLSKTLGIDPAALTSSNAVERLFARILDAGSTGRENELSRAVVSSLKIYDALVRHLVKLNLVHPDQDLEAPQTLVFPLLGPDVAQARTSEFLSFFSIKYKPGKGDGPPSLVIQQGKGAEERQRLLRNLGVDLINRNVHEIRISLRNDRVPILLGSDVWADRIVGGVRGSALLERMASSEDLMKLYLGLSRCSASTREAILRAGMGRDLVSLANAIAIYGLHLRFKDGKLVLPGSVAAWETVVGVSYSNPEMFLSLLLRRDEGRALMLYEGLSAAPEPVRSYLTQTPARLLELYQLLAPADSTRLATWYGDAGRQDLGRVLRLLGADDSGLYSPVPPAFISQFSVVRAQVGQKERLDIPAIVQLMPKGPSSVAAPFYTPADTLELLNYLKTTRPASIDGSTMSLILQNAAQAPIFLDLIWYVEPSSDVLARYLAYCRDLVQSQEKDWNVNKTRSSQAFFYILSALCRERALDPTHANKILSDALSRFDTPGEAQFARNLAGLMADEVLPAIRSAVGPDGGDDPLMRALAGTAPDETFVFDGREFRLSGSGFRLQRMKAAIQQQSVAGLGALLDAYAVLSRIGPGAPAENAIHELAEKLKAVASAQRLKDVTKDGLRSVAHGDVEMMLEKLEAARTQRSGAVPIADLIASGLHVELGVSLLSYCYADNATPDIDLLTFDPHFIRKHRFYIDTPGARGTWRGAYLDQSGTAGSIMTGSLSGLDRELGRLETLQSGQSLGIEATGIVPTLLSGLRAVPYAMRSDRAQEYVALCARLGLELAILARDDGKLCAWVLRHAAGFISPKRQELLVGWLSHPGTSPEAQVLSPSELFLLGRGYVEDGGGECHSWNILCAGANGGPPVPYLHSPTLERLRGIPPAAGTPEAAEFQREVDLYGPQAHSRIGINTLSFSILDSYENLDKGLREQILFERICDLRIRLAELNYSLGLPPALAAFEGELAIRDIVPASEQAQSNNWRLALEQIARLRPANIRSWIEELTSRGCLTEAVVDRAESPGK
jgi:tetratricopeptide (TPR) repeat protein